LLPTPGKLVDAPRDVDIEPRIARGRVRDQALDALSVQLALSDHCLGAADCEVVHERRSRPIRLDEGRYSVQRLC
jgi:hypothetical protein